MGYSSFESVESLDIETQISLLQEGDAVERVWAAWALGRKLGTEMMPELLRSLKKSPAPGTRRHLIVVLVGLGERSFLETLAVRDPDEYVRATACRYLIRVAQPGDRKILQILVNRLLEDKSPVVRLTILQERKGVPILQRKHLQRLAEDPDPEVRHCAVQALGRDKELHGSP